MTEEQHVVALELFQDHYRACMMAPNFIHLTPTNHLGFIAHEDQGITGGTWDFGQILTDLTQNPTKAQAQFQKKIIDVLKALPKLTPDMADAVTHVGVAVTGTMHENTMYLLDSANTQLSEDEFYLPLQTAIRSVFPQANILVRNRSQLGGLAEYHLVSQHQKSHMIYISVSHGIGTGIINDGQLLDGANHLAGIAGHLIVDHDGDICGFCNQLGCMARVASGTAMAHAAAEAMKLHSIPALLDACLNPTDSAMWLRDAGGSVPFTYNGKEYPITGRAIMRASRPNNNATSEITKIVLAAANKLMIGVSSLIHIFDPELVVLGGIAPYNSLLRDTVIKGLGASTFIEQHHTQIKNAWLSDRAALIGAGLYAHYNGQMPQLYPHR